MKPRGIIYQAGVSSFSHGELTLKLTGKIRSFYFFIRGVGIGLIFFGIYLPVSSYGMMFLAELKYLYSQKFEQKSEINYSILEAENTDTVNVQNEAESIGLDSKYSIYIPKIDAKSKIIANVDAGNKDEYTIALTQGVAHAKGTNFPGQGGRIFLFSHSTDSPLNFSRYNAIFYLLRHLEEGDNIIVYFSDEKFEYKVTGTKIVSPQDTSWFDQNLDEEELVLMTCDPPGTSLRRLIVTASRVS